MASPPATSIATRRYRASIITGALLITASEFVFATMGAAVKAASVELPTGMIVFFRSLVGLVILLPLLLRGGAGGLWPSRGLWPLYFLRAGIGVAAMYCFFFALGRLPLADGMLLKLTAPLFMPLIAWFWLGERGSRAALIAVPIGMAGVVLVLEPTASFEIAALVGLAGGALAGWAKVSVRLLTTTEPATRVVFWFAVLATICSAPLALAEWQTPSPTLWLLLAAIGVLATLGQWLLTRGYGAASPAQIGPFTYTSVLFAGVLGFLIWDEVPGLLFAAGAALIIGAGLLALRRGPIRRAPGSADV